MLWFEWVIFILIVIGALALIALIIYTLFTLRDLRRTLRVAGRLMREGERLAHSVHSKLHVFDPLFNALAESIRSKEERGSAFVGMVAEWVYLGVALWKKLKQR